jgi:hypothetical protein
VTSHHREKHKSYNHKISGRKHKRTSLQHWERHKKKKTNGKRENDNREQKVFIISHEGDVKYKYNESQPQ